MTMRQNAFRLQLRGQPPPWSRLAPHGVPSLTVLTDGPSAGTMICGDGRCQSGGPTGRIDQVAHAIEARSFSAGLQPVSTPSAQSGACDALMSQDGRAGHRMIWMMCVPPAARLTIIDSRSIPRPCGDNA